MSIDTRLRRLETRAGTYDDAALAEALRVLLAGKEPPCRIPLAWLRRSLGIARQERRP